MKPRDSLKDYNKETLRAWPEALLLRLLKKSWKAILSFAHAFEIHSPLEGESQKPSGLCEG